MQFITIDDVQDDILRVNENDIDEANAFATDAGVRLGVAESDFIQPARYLTRRLAIVYACYMSALRSVGTDGSVIFNGQENVDIYAQKLKFYRDELNGITERLTASDFATKKTADRTIELWRG